MGGKGQRRALKRERLRAAREHAVREYAQLALDQLQPARNRRFGVIHVLLHKHGTNQLEHVRVVVQPLKLLHDAVV